MKTQPQRRPTAARCSQPKCPRGAYVRMKSTGKPLCSFCARLVPNDDKEKT
jgi:hypothetical protein